nr:unnamed protein product [Digitaria exilis]
MANFAIDPHPHVPWGFEVLPLAKEDFRELAEALKHFFAQDKGVRLLEFGHGYTRRFIKHDEGLHVREHPLDREVWLMKMLFPNDARTNSAIAKAVHLNDDACIPDDVVVYAGLHPRVRSWTCPIFLLKRKDVINLGDEDGFPPPDGGLAHPFPPPPPRWMGMDGPQDDNSAGHAASHSAHGPSADDVMSEDPAGNGGDNEQVDIGAAEEVSSHSQVNIGAADEVSGHVHQINQDATENDDIMSQLFVVPVNSSPVLSVDAVFPVLHPDAPLIPPGFEHVQIQAARGPGFIGPLPMPLVPYSSSDDDSVVEGFKDNASVEMAATNPLVYVAQQGEDSTAAPHLSLEIIQGMATGYL